MLDWEVSRTFDRRSALFITGGVLLTSILVMRMLQLQVFQHKKYRRLAENNTFRVRVNLPIRGKIMASDGVALARDDAVYRIYIVPAEVRDMDALLELVARESGLRPQNLARALRRITAARGFSPVIVKESATFEQIAAFRASELSGVYIEHGFSRRYPGRTSAAHVVGYVGGATNLRATDMRTANDSPFLMTGQAGLERQFNEHLAGTPGQSVISVDAMGRIVGEDESREVKPVNGHDLITTLREPIQRRLEELLASHDAGCGVVMDIPTGNIIAMASAPTFNPDSFRSEDGPEIMAELRGDPLKPFMNKAIEGLYPPGSTFKIAVALAALESGAVTPTEKIHCPGYWEYGRHMYHCWEKHGHGWMDMVGAMAHSCDIYFYQIALRIGIDAIKAMALRLGLATRLLNELPRETVGIMPDREWKEKNIRTRWQHGDTIISGIGQGFILTNCLQLCVMQARAVSNKIIIPRLVLNQKSEIINHKFEDLGLKEQNIKLVMDGLRKVLEQGGTAFGSAVNINGARMGGKTGTSQVRRISAEERATGIRTGNQLSRHLRNHGLFVGYAPLDNPRYAVSVITEHSGTSGPAAQTAAGVMREILRTK
ncbi:MAG: penicillin-binding protein 2 [Alphaproteobacteria bacterium]|nr:penicillin-binding protein 2 [Alphaproteobacteria bacterium]MCL2889638.1 penicillin-binding protein 2 [Alphaproteobacteria bacterium]